MVTLNQLRIFAAVGRCLNVTQASKKLHISQPAVSHQLKLLEENWGVKLYNPAARGVELTRDGQTYLKDAESILNQVENLEKRSNGPLAGGAAERLKVGGSHSWSVRLLPSVLATFMESRAHAEIDLRTGSSAAVEQMVADTDIDIGLITNPSRADSLRHERYLRGEYRAFVSSSHPLARKKQCGLADIMEFPFVLTRRDAATMSKTEKMLRDLARGVNGPKIALYCSSAHAVKATVKAGMGIGILHSDYVVPEEKSAGLRILRVSEVEREIYSYLVYRSSGRLPAIARDFLSYLREWPGRGTGDRGRETGDGGRD